MKHVGSLRLDMEVEHRVGLMGSVIGQLNGFRKCGMMRRGILAMCSLICGRCVQVLSNHLFLDRRLRCIVSSSREWRRMIRFLLLLLLLLLFVRIAPEVGPHVGVVHGRVGHVRLDLVVAYVHLQLEDRDIGWSREMDGFGRCG